MDKRLESFSENIHKLLSNMDESVFEDVLAAIEVSKRIFLIGNGGSQAICSHISTDFFKRLNKETYSLNSDSMITCLANDYGFENMYIEWIKRHELNCDEDIVICLSSSGRSKDIVNVVDYLASTNITTLFICGFDGAKDSEYYKDSFDNFYIHFDNHNYGVVEMATEIFLHSIVEDLVKE